MLKKSNADLEQTIVQHQRIITTGLITLMLMLCSLSPAAGFPSLPSSFYGTVKQGGENIPNGTLVEAIIDGKALTYALSENYQGQSVYSLDIPGDDGATEKIEGGTPGQTVQFRVGGVLADQTAEWTSGVNRNLDLILDAGKELAPALPTYTPVPSQTPIPQVTSTPNPTRPPTGAPTQTNTPETGEEAAGEEEPPPAASSTPKPTSQSTESESQADTVSQPKDTPQATDEGANPPEDTPKTTAVSDAAAEELVKNEPASSANPSLTPEEQSQAAAAKRSTLLLWISLPLLLLVGAAAGILTLRQKKKSGRESSLL